MSPSAALDIEPGLSIPSHELRFRATRAGGPGGQHVNTSSTRVELLWNLRTSRAISDAQRTSLLEKLSSRVDAQGVVRVVASAYRSQTRNREDARDRLTAMIRRALVVPKARKKTRPSKAARDKRLTLKRHVSDKKRARQPPHDEA